MKKIIYSLICLSTFSFMQNSTFYSMGNDTISNSLSNANPVQVTKEGTTYTFQHALSDYQYLFNRFNWLISTENFSLVKSFAITSTTFSATFSDGASEEYIKEKLKIFAEPMGITELTFN
jgi:hypothetical protein